MKIQDLIRDNKTNHYKLLTIVGDDPPRADQIIEYLKNTGWTVYDVEDIVLQTIEGVPEDEIKLSIGFIDQKMGKNCGE